MRKKTHEIEDKGLNPIPASPVEQKQKRSTGEEEIGEEGRTIKMRTRRAWTLGERTLQAGETVTLDAATAAEIVAAGYADYA